MRKMQSLGLGLVVMALVALLCGADAVWGQDVTATITGTVTDPSGAALAGVTVTAKEADRGTIWTAQTNEAGIFSLLHIPIGIYELKAEMKGFKTAVRPSLTLDLNQTARVDFKMAMGQVTETIEVTSEVPLLQADNATVSTIIDAATNEALPLATRNYVELTLLSPGAVTPNPSSFNTGDNVGSGGRPFINGNREQSNNFILDGMDNNQVSDNLLGYTPAPDAIQEFNLITQNASAEFGNFQGGIVSASIKSGTNQFHGDVWEFFRNDVLNANSWSNNTHTKCVSGCSPQPTSTSVFAWDPLPKAKLRWNMFGGTIGGPIVKNKLFVFGDYQGQRFDHPASQNFFNVFTAAERTGDFSALCNSGFTSGVCNDRQSVKDSDGVVHSVVIHQLYNPFSLNASNNRNPFPNNQIPVSMLDPVAKALFASPLYPTPINGGLQNNAVNISSNNFNSTQYDIKVDYNISEKDRLYARYSHAFQNNPTLNSFKLLGTGFSEAPIYSDVVNWTHVFNPSLLNEFRFGTSYIRLHNGTTFDSSVGNFGEALGIANSNHNQVVIAGLLGLNFSGGFASGVGNSEGTQRFPSTVIQVSDGVIITRGRHVLHTGFELWRDRINIFYAGNSGRLGSIGFAGNFTQAATINSTGGAIYQPFQATGGAGEADFFLGLPQNIQRGIAGGGWGQRSTVFAGYVQDDWRVTNNLTLNLGLRYEAHTPWVEQNNKQTNYGLFTGDIELAGQNGNSRALYKGQYGPVDFQPRFGFAWTPGVLGRKTVLRGAYTVSSYLEGTGTNLRLTLNPPWTPAEIGVNYGNLSLPTTTTDQGVVGSVPGDPYANASVRLWDPDFQPSIAQQWNFSIQHQLTNSTTLQVGYVGQYADHLANPMWLIQSMNPVLVPDPQNPGQFIIQTTPGPYMAGNPTLKAELGSIRGTFSNAWMDYNALQAVLQKRMSSGLQGQVAYTYSRCMTNSAGYYGSWGGQASPGMPYWQNVYDGKTEKGPCFYDETHNLTSYVLYQLPVGRGKKFGSNMNKAVNAVVGDWEVSGILTMHTGFAMTVNNWDDPSGTGAWVTRTDCSSTIGYPKTVIPASQGGGIQWFNPNNFTGVAPAKFGNCSNGKVRGPGLKNFDMGIKKGFSLGESRKLEFRSEFLNLTNTKILNAPTVFTGGTLGQITGSQGERNIQLALKFFF
jgi:hypothetical protein